MAGLCCPHLRHADGGAVATRRPGELIVHARATRRRGRCTDATAGSSLFSRPDGCRGRSPAARDYFRPAPAGVPVPRRVSLGHTVFLPLVSALLARFRHLAEVIGGLLRDHRPSAARAPPRTRRSGWAFCFSAVSIRSGQQQAGPSSGVVRQAVRNGSRPILRGTCLTLHLRHRPRLT